MRRLTIGVLLVLALHGQTSSLIDQAQAAFRAGDLDRAAGIAQQDVRSTVGVEIGNCCARVGTRGAHKMT